MISRVDAIHEAERRYPKPHDELEFAKKTGFIEAATYLIGEPWDLSEPEHIAAMLYPIFGWDPIKDSITRKNIEGAIAGVRWVYEQIDHPNA